MSDLELRVALGIAQGRREEAAVRDYRAELAQRAVEGTPCWKQRRPKPWQR